MPPWSPPAPCAERTSYIPEEIYWGFEFVPVVSLSKTGRSMWLTSVSLNRSGREPRLYLYCADSEKQKLEREIQAGGSEGKES